MKCAAVEAIYRRAIFGFILDWVQQALSTQSKSVGPREPSRKFPGKTSRWTKAMPFLKGKALCPTTRFARRKLPTSNSTDSVSVLAVHGYGRPMNYFRILAAKKENYARDRFRLGPLREIGKWHEFAVGWSADDTWKHSVYAYSSSANILSKAIHHCQGRGFRGGISSGSGSMIYCGARRDVYDCSSLLLDHHWDDGAGEHITRTNI